MGAVAPGSVAASPVGAIVDAPTATGRKAELPNGRQEYKLVSPNSSGRGYHRTGLSARGLAAPSRCSKDNSSYLSQVCSIKPRQTRFRQRAVAQRLVLRVTGLAHLHHHPHPGRQTRLARLMLLLLAMPLLMPAKPRSVLRQSRNCEWMRPARCKLNGTIKYH